MTVAMVISSRLIGAIAIVAFRSRSPEDSAASAGELAHPTHAASAVPAG